MIQQAKQKNILFEITDSNLLTKTGGVVQGMSGSPIIQNNKIIGAVNYVIVNDTKKRIWDIYNNDVKGRRQIRDKKSLYFYKALC